MALFFARFNNLLAKYKKQHANTLTGESGRVMDAMIKAGQLPLGVANELLALQKSNLSPEEYAAELNRLVREGKLSPAAAAQLLAQYTQQQMREQAKKGALALQQMAKSGQITPDVAKALQALQDKNLPVDQYGAELNRLVAAGKMTPESAAKLLAQYKMQRAGLGTMGTLTGLVSQEEAKASGLLNDMVQNKKLTPELAAALAGLQQKNATPAEYQNALNQLVQAKKLSPEDAQKLSASYQKLAAVRQGADRLIALQGNNASLADYAAELKRAVQAGLLTPEAAATLYEQYRAMTTPLLTGIAPTVESNVPSAVEFARLQQRVQAGASAPPETVEFTPAETKAQTDAAAADRAQRIEQLQTAMSGQAQSLIAAWQPPTMSHREGAPPKPKPEEGKGGSGGSSSSGGKGSDAESGITKRALIKAGTILFAVLETAVDSDYPDTPVMATIVSGDFKGAKLLGKLSLAQGQDRVSLIFNLMDMEAWPTTKSINAFAIDPDTARTVMASSVNYHYFKRFGAIMATSFLTGYSSAITNAGTATTGIFGTSTTHPALSPGNKIAVGLGQVGTTLGTAISSYINTPTTVKVNSGVGLGILFMGEVTG